jgi:hypothetical protein
MTDTQRNALIKKMMVAHSKKVLVSKEAARANLIAMGIYTESGALHPDYGGEKNAASA